MRVLNVGHNDGEIKIAVQPSGARGPRPEGDHCQRMDPGRCSKTPLSLRNQRAVSGTRGHDLALRRERLGHVQEPTTPSRRERMDGRVGARRAAPASFGYRVGARPSGRARGGSGARSATVTRWVPRDRSRGAPASSRARTPVGGSFPTDTGVTPDADQGRSTWAWPRSWRGPARGPARSGPSHRAGHPGTASSRGAKRQSGWLGG